MLWEGEGQCRGKLSFTEGGFMTGASFKICIYINLYQFNKLATITPTNSRTRELVVAFQSMAIITRAIKTVGLNIALKRTIKLKKNH